MQVSHIYATFFLCFLLSAMLLVIMPPTGAPGIGLTHGFIHIISHPLPLIGIVLVTLCCFRIQTPGWGLLPVLYTLGYLAGGLLSLDASHYPGIGYIGASVASLFVLLCLFIDSRLLFLACLALGSYALHIAAFSLQFTPVAADIFYFMLGQSIGLAFVLTATTSALLFCHNPLLQREAQRRIDNAGADASPYLNMSS